MPAHASATASTTTDDNLAVYDDANSLRSAKAKAQDPCHGRSAHLGGLNLTNSNKNVRSRTSAALAAVREAADHRLLDARTQGTRARAPVKVRPQKSHGEKLERCAKLRKVSDLMHTED